MACILGEVGWEWRLRTVEEVVAGGKGTRILNARDLAREEAEV